MGYLIDTDVLSELRKGKRCQRAVAQWLAGVGDDDVYLSVLTIGEIRRGIESIRRRDQESAAALENWLDLVWAEHGERILPVDREVADAWGRINVPDPMPAVDGLIAATAKVHGLTVATRNRRDFERAGIPCVNPFAD